MVDAVIVDGYTDEPAGLGVPPYLDAIQRYVAGAMWTACPDWDIKYFTIDEVRQRPVDILSLCNKAKLVVFIAGTAVPGKYLGGTPISFKELVNYSTMLDKPIKVLGGPCAKFGFGVEGGKAALPREVLQEHFDVVASGDVEIVVFRLLKEKLRVDMIEPQETISRCSDLLNEFAIRGARIVLDHPCYPKRLLCEIETYRGCARAFVGRACSFCIERFYGRPDFRPVKAIIKEVEVLYRLGVRHFRLGRQPDLYAYMAIGIGDTEFPRPNVEAIEKLFRGIRSVAPNLKTLHIDNVNPGTVAHWVEESRRITKIIVLHHTPGDVAAFGLESADPKVIKLNNLKVMPEEAMLAIKVINEVGSIRGWNGMPHLLPGINFVYGLIGETEETYRLNLEFMKEVLRRGYMVRRINIRQVMAFPGTEMWEIGDRIIRRHKRMFHIYKERMRKEVDLPMLKRIVPTGTVLREVYTEAYDSRKRLTYARQIGSYPLLIATPIKLPLEVEMNFMIVGHGYRSVTGIPYPIPINRLDMRVLRLIPGIGERLAVRIVRSRPFKSQNELIKCGVPESIAKACTFD
ncbi:MAG: radical SAM protein [Thermoprotei archaeon]|nr:MAG: radical SAM protein [Thermoprotei archaeon]RLF25642.1 MAG: radical SAM protein [Thermoprotei archaeon]